MTTPSQSTAGRPPPPPPLPGFEHVRRNWNNHFHAYAARILPGEYYVSASADEAISTTLGSCISACIRDKERGIGGMNHFMLPESDARKLAAMSATTPSDATRYGNFAMESLVNQILRNGGQRQNLEVKVFGGGRIISAMTDVGQGNIKFVHDFVATEGLTIDAEDVGDVYPRMVVYFPTTGKVKVKRLRSLHNNIIVEEEKHYIETITEKPVEGDIELF